MRPAGGWALVQLWRRSVDHPSAIARDGTHSYLPRDKVSTRWSLLSNYLSKLDPLRKLPYLKEALGDSRVEFHNLSSDLLSEYQICEACVPFVN